MRGKLLATAMGNDGRGAMHLCRECVVFFKTIDIFAHLGNEHGHRVVIVECMYTDIYENDPVFEA